MNHSNHRRLLGSGVSGLLLVAATPALAIDAMMLDDFSTGTDDHWIQMDQTADYCKSGGTYDASNGEYWMRSACDLEAGAAEFMAAQWVGVIDPVFDDGVVRAKVRHMNDRTTAWLNLRTWGDERVGLHGYRFKVSANGTQLSITRGFHHGEELTLAAKLTGDQLFEMGEYVFIEAGAVGRKLTLKVWREGDPEPAEPQLVTSDNIFTGGDVAIGISHEGPYDGRISAAFDDVSFRPDAPGDVNGSGLVDMDDLIEVLAAWGACGHCRADLNGDGFVDLDDALIVLAYWN